MPAMLMTFRRRVSDLGGFWFVDSATLRFEDVFEGSLLRDRDSHDGCDRIERMLWRIGCQGMMRMWCEDVA